MLEARCDGCHSGADADAGLDLSAGSAWASLVGAASTEAPGRTRVVPGDPDASYLVAKLEGTAGDQMPLGGAALPAATIATVRAWISAGAPDGAFGACDGGGGVARVSIRESTLTIGVGALHTLTVDAHDAGGAAVDPVLVSWRSSDPLTVFVDDGGVALGVRSGSASLVAIADGVESAPRTVTVSAQAVLSARFEGDVLPVLRRGCAVAGCHVDGVEKGDLRFDRDPDKLHDKLVGESAETYGGLLVAAADPARSFLFQKMALDTPPAGARMPYGGGRIAAADLAIVLRWVAGGAGL